MNLVTTNNNYAHQGLNGWRAWFLRNIEAISGIAAAIHPALGLAMRGLAAALKGIDSGPELTAEETVNLDYWSETKFKPYFRELMLKIKTSFDQLSLQRQVQRLNDAFFEIAVVTQHYGRFKEPGYSDNMLDARYKLVNDTLQPFVDFVKERGAQYAGTIEVLDRNVHLIGRAHITETFATLGLSNITEYQPLVNCPQFTILSEIPSIAPKPVVVTNPVINTPTLPSNPLANMLAITPTVTPTIVNPNTNLAPNPITPTMVNPNTNLAPNPITPNIVNPNEVKKGRDYFWYGVAAWVGYKILK